MDKGGNRLIKTILIFIIVFGVIVLVHEFGHYYFAKRSGILVREFSIGMGPKLYAHRKNGTTYTIRMLPIGGYVRMAGAGEEEVELSPGMPIAVELNDEGKIIKINTSKKIQLPNSIPLEVLAFDLEDDLYIKGYVSGDETQEKTYEVDHDATIIEESGTEVQIAPRDVQFQSAKLGNRMLTNFAGPMNNFILAAILFILIAFLQGDRTVVSTEIDNVAKDSPAQAVGLKKGDVILGVNGKDTKDWQKIVEAIQASPEKDIQLTIERNKKKEVVTVKPEKAVDKESNQAYGKIGVGPTIYQEPRSFGQKITDGLKTTLDSSLAIFRALRDLFGHFSLNKLGGPVMIFKMSAQVATEGVITILSFMAMLSVNLGIINLLPIPALDGGKLVLNIIEGVRGKPLSQEKEGMITLVGFAIMMLLMVLVTWNDIQRFFFR